MNKTSIALRKFQAVVIDITDTQRQKEKAAPAEVLTVNAQMMSLGYILSQDLFNALNRLGKSAVISFAETVIPALKEMKGNHVVHRPMYPNFPREVIAASDVDLYWNAIMHYYSLGEWRPASVALPRDFAFETTKFQEITAIDEAKFLSLFTALLASRDSLSAEDKAIIHWFLNEYNEQQLLVPEDIPFHENKCLIAGRWLEQGRDITRLVKTATDVLRIATYLSGGDVSLADNTRFKSLPRKQRRALVKQLERVISEEDIGRHRNKWVRLFHNLHVGEFSIKVYRIARKARNNLTLESFYSHLEAAIQEQDVERCVALLSGRPGEFGRRLDQVLRLAIEVDGHTKPKTGVLHSLKALRAMTHYQSHVLEGFLAVVDAIPTRNLMQLLGHLNSRTEYISERVVFPKGNLQKAVIVEQPLLALDNKLLLPLQQGIRDSLIQRFAELETLGKVWIAPELIDCPLPTQQRSASAALHNMARGTRLPIMGDKDTLRFFVYWKGQDIDLSATFHNEAGEQLGHVSYTHLRSYKYQAYHSGDIVSAPKGASEFIDINLPAASKQARYLAMNVLVFSGPSFAEHETCFVGWMTRSTPNSNEVYDPTTVQQKMDLNMAYRNAIPVVFDLQERKAIWLDLPSTSNSCHANNVENNKASIQQKLQAILKSNNKLSLYELFELHVQARGELVTDRSDADTVFAFEGDVTPHDVHIINAEYVV